MSKLRMTLLHTICLFFYLSSAQEPKNNIIGKWYVIKIISTSAGAGKQESECTLSNTPYIIEFMEDSCLVLFKKGSATIYGSWCLNSEAQIITINATKKCGNDYGNYPPFKELRIDNKNLTHEQNGRDSKTINLYEKLSQ